MISKKHGVVLRVPKFTEVNASAYILHRTLETGIQASVKGLESPPRLGNYLIIQLHGLSHHTEAQSKTAVPMTFQASIVSQNSKYLYKLSSAVCYGQLASHFTALAKEETGWLKYDGSSCVEVEFGEVDAILNESAYCLFYVASTEEVATTTHEAKQLVVTISSDDIAGTSDDTLPLNLPHSSTPKASIERNCKGSFEKRSSSVPAKKRLLPVQNKVNERNTKRKKVAKIPRLKLKKSNAKKMVESESDSDTPDSIDEETDITADRDCLLGIDSNLVDRIESEIMHRRTSLVWDDIAGLEFAKKTVKETVIWPLQRPDLFTGLRSPAKGLLLFGPPGTGKTLIGKCIASQAKATFFSISASSLTSKWVGEGEKMVKALFAVARSKQPSVIFVDEIDSLLSQRCSNEHEASRRMKTEFFVQLDGATCHDNDRILIVGATNRPQEHDEAARRRFVKRLYIPLPDREARRRIVLNLLRKENYKLDGGDIDRIVERSEGYSGADMASLCREAAFEPMRTVPVQHLLTIRSNEVPAILLKDFEAAFKQVRASVSQGDMDFYVQWNKEFGSFGP